MSKSIVEAKFDDGRALGAPEDVVTSSWVVMKFGGSSVSTAKSWNTIAKLVRARLDEGLRPVIVHSALKGVSNALEGVLTSAVNDDPSNTLANIRSQHYELATALGLDGPAMLDDTMHELEQLVAGVRLVREVSVRVRVRIMALGELMATRLGAAYLASQSLPVQWVDARELLTSRSRSGRLTSNTYLSATCDFEQDLKLQERLAADAGMFLSRISKRYNAEPRNG